MKKIAFFAAVIMACAYVNPAHGVSVVKNGSFENDGTMYLSPAIIPEYWCSFDNESDFVALIDNSWSTHGNYGLTMYPYMFGSFQPNDSATISQSVHLTSADQIIFDLHLFASYGYPWDPNVITAFVLIDGSQVWNSDGLTYTSGQFSGRITIDINEIFKDENPHILSLQLKTDVGNLYYVEYVAQWDRVALYTSCGVTNYLPADLTHDCVVDINDLELLADGWLDPAGPDITGDASVDFKDFAVLAHDWLSDSHAEPFIPDSNFVFLDADFNDDGVVDCADILVFCEDWLSAGGSCVRTDLNKDGVIDLADFAPLAEDWLLTGDLYGL